MATRERWIAEFSTDLPAADVPHELLCEDHAGTYSCGRAARCDGIRYLSGMGLGAMDTMQQCQRRGEDDGDESRPPPKSYVK